ncbi:MAG: hypothetical protein GXO48_07050 [Chlorobi bacterium]|nr:hypothetical protein [Chlorobiota bacterium]
MDAGLYAIMSPTKNFFPTNYCVLPADSQGNYPVVVVGSGPTWMPADVVLTSGWGLYRFLIDPNSTVRFDTAYVFEDSVTDHRYYYDDMFWRWGECNFPEDKDTGVVVYMGQHKISVGQGREADFVLTRAFSLRKALLNKKGHVYNVVQVPLFKINGYDPQGFNASLVYSIDSNNNCEYSYGAVVSDLDFTNRETYVLLWEFVGDSLFNVRPDSTPMVDRWHGGCSHNRFIVAVLDDTGSNDTIIYSSLWRPEYLLDDNWFFYLDLSEHFVFDLVRGQRSIAIRMPYSVALDSSLGISTTRGIWLPIDSSAYMYVLSLADSFHYAGGVVYRISTEDPYSGVKVLQLTYKILKRSYGNFSTFCMAGLWTMDNQIIGDSVLQAMVSLAPVCSLPDSLTIVPIAYWSSGDTIIDAVYIGDTLSKLDSVPILLKIRFNFLKGQVSIEVIDTTTGWYGAVSTQKNKVVCNSRMQWRYAEGGLMGFGGIIERYHETLEYYEQKYRIISPSNVSRAFLPASPIILKDGRMLDLVRELMVPPSSWDEDILVIDEVDSVFYRVVYEPVPDIWELGRTYEIGNIILVVVGCPRLDSSEVLQGLDVNYEVCNLEISTDSLWNTVLGSVDTFSDGTLALDIDFGDGCIVSYRFDNAFSDTTFVDLGYVCGELRVGPSQSANSLQSGNAIYFLYNVFDSLISINDSGVFEVWEPGLYYVVGIDTSGCIYQYSDSVEVTFIRSGGPLYQAIGSRDELLIVGQKGLERATISSVAGDVSQVVRLIDLGLCSEQCGEQVHIYRLRMKEELPSGTYILNVSDEEGFTKPVKIVVQ